MNLKVRLGKLFNESSNGVPALLPTAQESKGNSHEIVYPTSLSGSFCHVVYGDTSGWLKLLT